MLTADVDFRATYLQNHFTDLRQTLGFARNNIREINPIWKDMVRKKDYTLLAAGWVTEAILTDALVERGKVKYRDLAVWRLIVVGLNARKHGYGIPVVVVRF